MFGQTFYHRTIRKYVTYFGTLFNDIHITRENSSGNTVQTLKIPITYSPKQKALARLDADPKLNKPASMILPFMAFEMTSLEYDASRKLATINRGHLKKFDENRLQYVYNPVPYNINFSLYIMVKNAEDGTKILEQILPFFSPDWTATLNLIPELDIKMDTPVVIKSVTSDDSYEGGFEERRVLTWTLDFTMIGYLFGPVKKNNVIKLANVNFLDSTSHNFIEGVSVYPGLTANGTPTTDPENTIDKSQINVDDDWGYIVVKES